MPAIGAMPDKIAVVGTQTLIRRLSRRVGFDSVACLDLECIQIRASISENRIRISRQQNQVRHGLDPACIGSNRGKNVRSRGHTRMRWETQPQIAQDRPVEIFFGLPIDRPPWPAKDSHTLDPGKFFASLREPDETEAAGSLARMLEGLLGYGKSKADRLIDRTGIEAPAAGCNSSKIASRRARASPNGATLVDIIFNRSYKHSFRHR